MVFAFPHLHCHMTQAREACTTVCRHEMSYAVNESHNWRGLEGVQMGRVSCGFGTINNSDIV
jgi:hypothetical protein